MDDGIKDEIIRKIAEKHVDKVPVVIRCNSKNIIPAKTKYIVSRNSTISSFLSAVKRDCKGLTSATSLFFLTVSGTILISSSTLGEVFEKHKNKNGYLILNLVDENTFGNAYQTHKTLL